MPNIVFEPSISYNIPLASGPLAQLVEHRTFNPGVTGSIPVRLTIFFARVAELADALDLGSSGVTPVGVQVPSLAPFSNNLNIN